MKFDTSDNVSEQLVALKSLTKSASEVDVISDALGLYEYVVKRALAGEKMYTGIVQPDGTYDLTEITTVGMERAEVRK